MLPPSWNIKEPQRVCDACFGKLGPFQRRWVDLNANALRTNELASDDVTKQLNSPLRFTLGGEVRKAAYTLENLMRGINYSHHDAQVRERSRTFSPLSRNVPAHDARARRAARRGAQYYNELLKNTPGLLFLTIGKVAFIGGIRVGTGLVVSRLPDGSWSAPCAVGTIGVTFGAVIGAEVSDMVTSVDRAQIDKFADPSTCAATRARAPPTPLSTPLSASFPFPPPPLPLPLSPSTRLSPPLPPLPPGAPFLPPVAVGVVSPPPRPPPLSPLSASRAASRSRWAARRASRSGPSAARPRARRTSRATRAPTRLSRTARAAARTPA